VTTIEVALRRRRTADELERTLESCLADARQLKRLVHVLMEHARGEATAAHAEAAEPVDAAQLLEECAEVARTLAEAKDVRLERSFPAPLPVVTQPQRLRSVVMNLLSNAVSYNRPGGLIELRARLEAGTLEVMVRDTGRGIAAQHLPHLFEPFYRGDGARLTAPVAGPEEPHMGLGLFLVDSHLKALGGRCSVQSEVGVGTTFIVSVPAGAAAVAGGSAVTPGFHGSSGTLSVGSPNISASPAVWQGVGVTP
jgi:signal transduction histidine kinase